MSLQTYWYLQTKHVTVEGKLTFPPGLNLTVLMDSPMYDSYYCSKEICVVTTSPCDISIYNVRLVFYYWAGLLGQRFK